MIGTSSISIITFRQRACHWFGLDLSDEVGTTELLVKLGQWLRQRGEMSRGLVCALKGIALGTILVMLMIGSVELIWLLWMIDWWWRVHGTVSERRWCWCRQLICWCWWSIGLLVTRCWGRNSMHIVSLLSFFLLEKFFMVEPPILVGDCSKRV